MHPGRWVGRLDELNGGDQCVLTVDGRSAVAGTDQADAMLTSSLGRAVALTRVVPWRPRRTTAGRTGNNWLGGARRAVLARVMRGRGRRTC